MGYPNQMHFRDMNQLGCGDQTNLSREAIAVELAARSLEEKGAALCDPGSERVFRSIARYLREHSHQFEVTNRGPIWGPPPTD
ncbi:hypothetical protein ACN8ZM_40455 (plasmid) [Burkholderia aenigmatica]|uniref:hypothetical protein n=1 Tax=Burkholderia aenigmatica TaxID=2015348 RepID=UPI003B43164B